MKRPSIISVKPGRGRIVYVTWKTGVEHALDLSSHFAAYKVFSPLRKDNALFRTVKVGEWGWNLHWTDDMEVPAELLWQMALEQDAADLKRWRSLRHMNQPAAAKALGLSPRMYKYYESASHPVPKTVHLALAGYDALTRKNLSRPSTHAH